MTMKRVFFAICLSLLIVSLSVFASAAEITSANDLLTLMNTSSMWEDDYKLTADINLADATNGLSQAPIGNATKKFTGTFDGQGHTISGLNLSGTDYVALFGQVADATICNLTVSGTVTATGTRAAGIVAQVDGAALTVKNCTNLCNVTGDTHVGGVIGRMVPGDSNAFVIGCKNAGTITGSGTYAGGIVATFSQNGGGTTIEQCMNTGSVTGSQYVAGIVGYFRVYSASKNKCFLQDCMNTGAIHATSRTVGGIIGSGNGQNNAYTITRCFNSGSVTADGTTYIQPIAGAISKTTYTAGQMTYCYYSSTDTYTNDATGYAFSCSTFVEAETVAANFPGLGSAWIVVDGRAPELAVFHKHDASGAYTPAGNKHVILCYCGEAALTEAHSFVNGVCTKCGAEESSCAHENITTVTEATATCVSAGVAYEFCLDCESKLGDILLPVDATNHEAQVLTMDYANGSVTYTCGGCGAVVYTDSTLASSVYVSKNGLDLVGNLTAIGTESAPFKNFADAMQYAAYCGKDTKIILVDEASVDTDYKTPSFSNTVTVTGGKLITQNRFNMYGNVVFEHITISPSVALVLAARGHKLVLGEGITVDGADMYLVGGYESSLDGNSDIPATGFSTDITIRSGTYHAVGGGNRFLSGAYSGTIKMTVGKTDPEDTLRFNSTLVTGSLNYEGGDGVNATLVFDGDVDFIETFRPITHPSSEVEGRFDVDLVVQGDVNVAAEDIHLRGQDYTLNVYADSRVDGAEAFAALIVGAENVQPYKRYCLKVNGAHPDTNGDMLCDNCGASVNCEHENGEWRETEKATCVSGAHYVWYCYDCMDVVAERTTVGEAVDAERHISEDYTWQYADGMYSFTCTACSVKTEQAESPVVYVSVDGNDSYDGTTADKAVASLTDAVGRIANVGGTIVICGSYPISGTVELPAYAKAITFSGLDEDNGYIRGGFKLSSLTVLSLGGETKFDGISFDGGYACVFECNWHDLTFGKVEAINNAFAHIVAGMYKIAEDDTAKAESVITIHEGATLAYNAAGTINKTRFYSHVYLGSSFSADGVSASDKKVTFNATDADVGVLYTMSTTGTYKNNPVENCETIVNLYGDTSVNQGRTGDYNVGYSDSTAALSKQTLNFFDNSSIGTDYYIRNAENTVINVSTAADGRTRPLTIPFTFYAYGTFASEKTPMNIAINYGSHSYATWCETPLKYQNAADALKVVTENVTDECKYTPKVTVVATPDSAGTKLYSCSCGRSYTEQYTYSCEEEAHIYVAKADGTYVCTSCGETYASVTGDCVFALSPAVVDGETVSVTLSVNASAIAAAKIDVIAPDGFTFAGTSIPVTDGFYVSASDTEPCTVVLLSETGANATIQASITLSYTVAESVKAGEYTFMLAVSEAFDENREAITATPVSAVVTVPADAPVLGDVNGDGAITVLDVLLAIKALLNEETLANADMNGDGVLSLIDVIRIMKAVSK